MDKNKIDLLALFHRADEIASTSVKGRPKNSSDYVPKKHQKVRFNQEVVDWIERSGQPLGTRANAILEALMEADKKRLKIEPKNDM